MTFPDNSGNCSAPSAGKRFKERKLIYKGAVSAFLLVLLLLPASTASFAAVEVAPLVRAFQIASSLPRRSAAVVASTDEAPALAVAPVAAPPAAAPAPPADLLAVSVPPVVAAQPAAIPAAPLAAVPPAVPALRRSDFEEAAGAAISSVRGIAGLMKQAYELTAMLPTRQKTEQALPKSDIHTAQSVVARLPEPAHGAAGSAGSLITGSSPVAGSQGLIWPVDGLIYSAFNASRGRRAHGAIDIVAKKGTPIAAVADGIVSVAANGGRNYSGYGKIVIIDHGKGLFTLYAHCDTLLVKIGQPVKQGEYIATVGRTGRATTDHCHFEVRVSGVKRDPLAYLPSRPEALRATNYRSGR